MWMNPRDRGLSKSICTSTDADDVHVCIAKRGEVIIVVRKSWNGVEGKIEKKILKVSVLNVRKWKFNGRIVWDRKMHHKCCRCTQRLHKDAQACAGLWNLSSPSHPISPRVSCPVTSLVICIGCVEGWHTAPSGEAVCTWSVVGWPIRRPFCEVGWSSCCGRGRRPFSCMGGLSVGPRSKCPRLSQIWRQSVGWH